MEMTSSSGCGLITRMRLGKAGGEGSTRWREMHWPGGQGAPGGAEGKGTASSAAPRSSWPGEQPLARAMGPGAGVHGGSSARPSLLPPAMAPHPTPPPAPRQAGAAAPETRYGLCTAERGRAGTGGGSCRVGARRRPSRCALVQASPPWADGEAGQRRQAPLTCRTICTRPPMLLPAPMLPRRSASSAAAAGVSGSSVLTRANAVPRPATPPALPLLLMVSATVGACCAAGPAPRRGTATDCPGCTPAGLPPAAQPHAKSRQDARRSG